MVLKHGRFYRSCIQGRAAGLDGLNLRSRQGLAVETRGEVIAVEENPLGRGDWAKLGAGVSADASVHADGLAERAELLGVVAVGAKSGVRGAARKGLREGVGRRGGMGLGRVIDRCCHHVLISPCLAALVGDWLDIPGIVRLPRNLMEGVRSACTAAWRRTLVANIVVVVVVVVCGGIGLGRGVGIALRRFPAQSAEVDDNRVNFFLLATIAVLASRDLEAS